MNICEDNSKLLTRRMALPSHLIPLIPSFRLVIWKQKWKKSKCRESVCSKKRTSHRIYVGDWVFCLQIRTQYWRYLQRWRFTSDGCYKFKSPRGKYVEPHASRLSSFFKIRFPNHDRDSHRVSIVPVRNSNARHQRQCSSPASMPCPPTRNLLHMLSHINPRNLVQNLCRDIYVPSALFPRIEITFCVAHAAYWLTRVTKTD